MESHCHYTISPKVQQLHCIFAQHQRNKFVAPFYFHKLELPEGQCQPHIQHDLALDFSIIYQLNGEYL